MVTRRHYLNHLHAGRLELPLLVPAFSSKGFAFLQSTQKRKKREYSELAVAFIHLSAYLTTSVLVSAYDMHYDHLLSPKHKNKDLIEAMKKPRVVFLDSGGYELIEQFDSTENRFFPHKAKQGFGIEQYDKILAEYTLPRHSIHFIISNFDYFAKGEDLSTQISMARGLFRKYPMAMSDFIIKPLGKKAPYHDFKKYSKADFANLTGFDIIGVTEKELGKRLIDRIENIYLLRQGLNGAGISCPIHVWGGLDPIITPLLFFAGAEVFDGVSWLRYSYKNGLALCRESYSVLEPKVSIEEPLDTSRTFSCIDNIRFLDRLAILLQQWVDLGGTDFSVFDELVKEHLERAYKLIHTKFKEI